MSCRQIREIPRALGVLVSSHAAYSFSRVLCSGRDEGSNVLLVCWPDDALDGGFADGSARSLSCTTAGVLREPPEGVSFGTCMLIYISSGVTCFSVDQYPNRQRIYYSDGAFPLEPRNVLGMVAPPHSSPVIICCSTGYIYPHAYFSGLCASYTR